MIIPLHHGANEQDSFAQNNPAYTATLRIIAINGEWIRDQEVQLDHSGRYTFNYQTLPEGIYDLHLYLAGMPLHAQRVEVKA